MYLFDTTKADLFALALPAVSALCGVASGICALVGQASGGAITGIASALFAAAGIYATSRTSKVRDDQMRFWIEQLAENQARCNSGFGS